MIRLHNISFREEFVTSAITDLFHLVWGGKKDLILSKTNWAFIMRESTVICAYDNDKLIAVRGGMAWPLLLHANLKISSYQLHGTCVHPDYRRLGLFSKLTLDFITNLQAKEVILIFNVSVKASRLGYEKLGWKYVTGFHRLTWLRNPAILIKYLNQKSKEIVIDYPIENTNSIEQSLIDARHLQFNNYIHTEWNYQMLEWRLSNKMEGYRIFKSKGNAVIYKIRMNGNKRELVIGDYFLKENKYSIFKSVHKTMLKLEKPDIAYTYIFNTHPYYFYLIRSLFLPNPLNYNLNFGMKFISGDKTLLSHSKLALSFLDIDTF